MNYFDTLILKISRIWQESAVMKQALSSCISQDIPCFPVFVPVDFAGEKLIFEIYSIESGYLEFKFSSCDIKKI